MTDSRTYPDLERVPGKQNWVDKSGGLPNYIERIAKHIHYEGGRPISQAIAAAVNTVKRWCHGGTVSKSSGPETSSHVSAKTRALACKAVAEWDAKRAKASLSLGFDRDAYSDLDLAQQIGGEIEAHLALSTGEASDELDLSAFQEHLAQEREERGLDLATDIEAPDGPVQFDPRQQPVNPLSLFKRVIARLEPGQIAHTPGGTTIKRLDSRFIVTNRHQPLESQAGFSDTNSVSAAAERALVFELGSSNAHSMGGEKAFTPDALPEPFRTEEEDEDDASRERMDLLDLLFAYYNEGGLRGVDMYHSNSIDLPNGYTAEPDQRGSFILVDPDGEVCGWGADEYDLAHAYQHHRYG